MRSSLTLGFTLDGARGLLGILSPPALPCLFCLTLFVSLSNKSSLKKHKAFFYRKLFFSLEKDCVCVCVWTGGEEPREQERECLGAECRA